MSEVVISAEIRNDLGTANVRKIRKQGRVPGIVYGADKTPSPVTFDKLELARMLRNEHSIINVTIAGEEQQSVVKSVQVHPLTGDLLHIDFMRVVAGQELTITVPVNIIGTAVGIKSGGIFSVARHDVQISVLPRFMPDHIDIDCSALNIGDAIRIKDIKAENFILLDDEDEIVCQVVMPRKEEEKEEVAAEEIAEPEVITARAEEESDSE
jgi:large subunit ribosomal protein L25